LLSAMGVSSAIGLAGRGLDAPPIKQLTPRSARGKGDAASRDIGLRYKIRRFPPTLYLTQGIPA